MRLARALFRLALLSYPPRLRSEFEDEAVEAFLAGLRSRRGAGTLASGRYVCAAILDTVVAGIGSRWRAVGDFRGATGNTGSDLRYALRRLLRAPAFSLSIVALLGLGVGGNAAVLSALRHGVFAEPPFPEAHRLVFPRVVVEAADASSTRAWSYPQFRELRESAVDLFDRVVAYATRYATWSEPGQAESMPFEFVTPGYFEMLGAIPATGRFFAPEEESVTTPPDVVVLSHATWRARFGGDTAAVGAPIVLDGRALRVVGVAAPEFRGLSGRAAYWVPIGQARPMVGTWSIEARNTRWLHVVARLREGVSLEQATLRLGPIVRHIEATAPTTREGEQVRAALPALGEIWTNPATRRSLWLVSSGAMLVLVVAIANIAGLLLARGRRDARDRAVRLALGASRWRLVRQNLLEALVLAVAGGAAGVLLAGIALAGMRTLWPSHLLMGAVGDVQSIDPASLAVDPVIGASGFGLAAVAALAAAVAAALGTGSFDLAPALRRASGGRGSGSRQDAHSRSWLVAVQIAFSVVLLVGAGLLSSTLLRMHAEQRGFVADRLLAMGYSLVGRPAMASQTSLRDFHMTLRDRVAAMPGVAGVALGSSPPLAGGFMRTEVRGVSGQPEFAEGRRPPLGMHVADSRLFHTLGIGVVRGRTFTASEERSEEPLLVLSRTAADMLFPGEDPIGRRITMAAAPGDPNTDWTVVGVVDDVLYGPVAEGARAEAYMPLGVWAPPGHTLFVRTAGDPEATVPHVREMLAALDPAVAFSRVLTGHQLRTQGLADTRALTFLLLIFAGLAVLLSAVGVWSVAVQSVAERHREIGIRVALGADTGAVERLVLGQSLAPALAGSITGLALAAIGASYLSAFLFRTAPHDARVYAAASLLVTIVAFAACWVPARRAARIDPVESLSAN
jgi:putative ABC transport system permease protein